MTPAGSVAIQLLLPGQRVYSINSAGLQPAIVTGVTEVFPSEFIEIVLPEETVNATAEHPFEVAAGTFVTAAKLRAGDTVIRWNGQALVDCTIVSVHRAVADRPAYNLTVMPGETFLADGVVVHNKGCFLPDTPVLKADGSSSPISMIHAGDTVMAFNADLHPVPASVLEVVSIAVDGYLQITTDRVTLSVTDEHPFFVGDGKFKTAVALRSGDTVFAFDGRGLVPQVIRSITPVAGNVRVYNLRTDEPHTYFAAGIAVHNKGGGGGHGGGGGGGHFGGGGFGGRGFGGSGGDGADECFLIGVFFFVVVFYLIRAIGGNTHEADGTTQSDFELDFIYPASTVQPKAEATTQVLRDLTRSDPSFDPDQLRDLTRKVFLQLQSCWQSQNYEPMRALLTPSLFAQHQTQLAAMKETGEINRIDSLQIDSIDLVHVHHNPGDTHSDFTALITAVATDYYVNARTNRFLRGDTAPAQFQEFWTFGRNETGWVLRRIEQSRESNMLRTPNSLPGDAAAETQTIASTVLPSAPVDTLLAVWGKNNPMWNRGQMIDRVSAVFTKLALAGQGNGASVPPSEVNPHVMEGVRARLEHDRRQGIRTEIRNFDVRHVEVVAVRREFDASRCQFLARISAHSQSIVTQGDHILNQDPDVRAFTRFCVFSRWDGVWQLHEVLTPEQATEYAKAGNVDRTADSENDSTNSY